MISFFSPFPNYPAFLPGNPFDCIILSADIQYSVGKGKKSACELLIFSHFLSCTKT